MSLFKVSAMYVFMVCSLQWVVLRTQPFLGSKAVDGHLGLPLWAGWHGLSPGPAQRRPGCCVAHGLWVSSRRCVFSMDADTESPLWAFWVRQSKEVGEGRGFVACCHQQKVLFPPQKFSQQSIWFRSCSATAKLLLFCRRLHSIKPRKW